MLTIHLSVSCLLAVCCASSQAFLYTNGRLNSRLYSIKISVELHCSYSYFYFNCYFISLLPFHYFNCHFLFLLPFHSFNCHFLFLLPKNFYFRLFLFLLPFHSFNCHFLFLLANNFFFPLFLFLLPINSFFVFSSFYFLLIPLIVIFFLLPIKFYFL